MGKINKAKLYPKEEYKKLVFYGRYSREKLDRPFAVAQVAITNQKNNIPNQFFDFDELKSTIDRILDYMHLQQKYSNILNLSKDQLTVNDTGFHLDGHVFKSLEEVKKALMNRSLT
jgi:hypothetical protein